MPQRLRLARALIFTFAVVLPLHVALAQNEPEQPSAPPPQVSEPEAQESPTPHPVASKRGASQQPAIERQNKELRIFRLKHTRPQEIMQLITVALTSRSQPDQNQTPIAQPGFGGGLPGRSLGPGGSLPGMVMPGMDAAAQHLSDVRIAADEQSGMLFVRAPQKKLQQVQSLIDAFDAPASELGRNEFNGLLFAPLPNDKANRLVTILQQLDIRAGNFALGEQRLLVIDVSEQQNAEQTVAILDALEESEETRQGEATPADRDGDGETPATEAPANN